MKENDPVIVEVFYHNMLSFDNSSRKSDRQTNRPKSMRVPL